MYRPVLIYFASLLFSNLFAAEIMVSAASSLTDAIKEISKVYQDQYIGESIILNMASSGSLRGQIEKGAPVDVFLSASNQHMDLLESKGLLVQNSRVNFASNSLCIIAPTKGARVTFSIYADLLGPKVTRIAIGSPGLVPVGKYAKESFSSLGMWDKLLSKFVYGVNVRQVLDYTARGEVDFGVVYRTDALIRNKKVSVVKSFSSKLHSNILYPGAVIQGSKNVEKSKQFVHFLKTEKAQEILTRYGFSAK